MSGVIDDGGPAFPVPDQQHTGGLDGYYGMTLRDYFAAKAMQAMLAAEFAGMGGSSAMQSWAHQSYEQADAMLEARKP